MIAASSAMGVKTSANINELVHETPVVTLNAATTIGKTNQANRFV